jgi:hypothetical protein
MFENKRDPLLPLSRFIGRLGWSVLATLGLALVALLIGVLGYHYIARLSLVDSLLNAAMILTGMGPVNPMQDASSKLFASAYALFSGFVVLTSMGIVLSPVFHRLIHTFHLAEDGDDDPAK